MKHTQRVYEHHDLNSPYRLIKNDSQARGNDPLFQQRVAVYGVHLGKEL